METLSDVFDDVESMLSKHTYNGNVSLYLMRYRTKSNESGEKVHFPSFYNPQLDEDIQCSLLKILKDSRQIYNKETTDYVVNGGSVNTLSKLDVNNYGNVEKLFNDLDNKVNVKPDLSKINMKSLKCYIVEVKLSDNTKIYYFGNIRNFSTLQSKSLMLRRTQTATSNSELKKFDISDTVGFDLDVVMIKLGDNIYVSKIAKFETIFRMSEYFMNEANTVIDSVCTSQKIDKGMIPALKNVSTSDSRIAKMVMKLKYRKAVVNTFFERLDDDIFKDITEDEKIGSVYDDVTFIDGKLSVKNVGDIQQIKAFIKFIADTAKRGIGSGVSSTEDY